MRCRKGDPGAVRSRSKTDTWYADVNGQRVSLGTADEAQAWIALRDRQRRARDEAAGIVDSYQDHARRPLGNHVMDWTATVRARGACAQYVAWLGSHLLHLADIAGWARIVDLTAESCALALARLN